MESEETETEQEGVLSAEDGYLCLRFHILFDPNLGLMRCGLCQRPTILRSGIQDHMGRFHGVKISEADADRLITRFFQPCNQYFAPTRLMLPPIPFLPIVRGFQCQQCIYYCARKAIMKEHYKKKHPNQEPVLFSCSVQSIASYPIKKYIGVVDAPQADPPRPNVETHISELRHDLLQVIRGPEPPHVHEPAQHTRLLVNLGWDKNILNSEQRDLLLSYPQAEGQPFFKTFEALQEFFLFSMKLISLQDCRIQKLLKPDDVGFHELQEEHTRTRYSRFMARFVFFCVSKHEIGLLRVTEDMANCLYELGSCIERIEDAQAFAQLYNTNGDFVNSLIGALEHVLNSRPPSLSSKDLVPMFLRVNCQKPDGTVTSIDSITQSCSMVYLFIRPMLSSFFSSSLCSG